MKQLLSKIWISGLNAFPLLLTIGVWEFLSNVVDEKRFPGIFSILLSLEASLFSNNVISSQGGGIYGFSIHVLSTYYCHVLGLGLGVFLGISIALTLFLNPKLKMVTMPFLTVLRTVPPLVLVPFVLLVIHHSIAANVFLVSLYVTYAVIVYALNSLELIQVEFLELGKVYKVSTFKNIFDILLPGMLPYFRGGLRVTISISLGVLIVSEYIGPSLGIGKVFKYAIAYSDTTLILTGIVWSILIVSVNDFLFFQLIKRLNKWIE